MVMVGMNRLQGGLMSERVGALILVLAFIAVCVMIGNATQNKHRESVCSIKGKSTYIYGGYEYSCLNGGRLK